MAQEAKAKVESELTREQLRAAFSSGGPYERQLMTDLSKAGTPREAALVAEILHFFPDSFVDDSGWQPNPDENRMGKHQRPGAAAETQMKAAVAALPMTGTARRRVLDFIRERGDSGATDEEIQDALNMNPSTQRPRRVELVEDNWVEDSKRRRLTHSGRESVVWVAK